MKFSQVVKARRSMVGVPFTGTLGASTLLTGFLRKLYNPYFLNEKRIGKIAERLGNIVRVDDVTISMDNPFLSTYCKGTIVLNYYEHEARQIFQQYFPKNEPIIELGGSIGVVSCMVNRRLISPEQHIVVEANPGLIPTLKKNRDLNHCQFQIIEAALAYDGLSITFYTNDGSTGGSVYKGEGRAIQVATQTLQSIAEKAGFRHFHLIADIEGSEFDLIEHEMDFLRENVGLMLLEIHAFNPNGLEGVYTLIEKIEAHGFECLGHISNNYYFRNTAQTN